MVKEPRVMPTSNSPMVKTKARGDQWNSAVETIAEYFERKAKTTQLGYATTSYETVAAIVRSYIREPEPQTLQAAVDRLILEFERIDQICAALQKSVEERSKREAP
jgi:hypothetical protein